MGDTIRSFTELRESLKRMAKGLEREWAKREAMRVMLDQFAPSGWQAQLEMVLKDEELMRQAAEYCAPIVREIEDAMYQLQLQIDPQEPFQRGKPN